jgi:hypothetical protein
LITGNELIDFATEHGLIIPFKDTDEWAAEINKNDGRCLCDDSRTCPCDESIIDCQNDDPKQQICLCFLISTTKYAEEFGLTPDMWAKKSPTTGENEGTNYTQSSTPTGNEDYTALTPEIQTDIDTMKTARDALTKDDFDTAYNTLAESANTNDCGICAQYMITTAQRINFLAALRDCGESDFDVSNYNDEKSRALDWMTQMISFFIQVDMSLNGIETTDQTNEATIQDNNSEDDPKKPGFHSPYQACMSKNMSIDDIKNMKQQARFCIATKMCRSEPAPLEQAKEYCKKAHPSWFTV